VKRKNAEQELVDERAKWEEEREKCKQELEGILADHREELNELHKQLKN
jgi:uncharacterized protein